MKAPRQIDMYRLRLLILCYTFSTPWKSLLFLGICRQAVFGSQVGMKPSRYGALTLKLELLTLIISGSRSPSTRSSECVDYYHRIPALRGIFFTRTRNDLTEAWYVNTIHFKPDINASKLRFLLPSS